MDFFELVIGRKQAAATNGNKTMAWNRKSTAFQMVKNFFHKFLQVCLRQNKKRLKMKARTYRNSDYVDSHAENNPNTQIIHNSKTYKWFSELINCIAFKFKSKNPKHYILYSVVVHDKGLFPEQSQWTLGKQIPWNSSKNFINISSSMFSPVLLNNKEVLINVDQEAAALALFSTEYVNMCLSEMLTPLQAWPKLSLQMLGNLCFWL